MAKPLYSTITYKFQFDGDKISCLALLTMIGDDWEVKNYIVEDGYAWFILEKKIFGVSSIIK